MKLRTIQIENFRSFKDETISLNRYSCFVGTNGSGKSTVLCALNVFFRDQASSSTDISKLADEDYFGKNTTEPVRITVTFDELGTKAEAELGDYCRNGELVVTAEAVFEDETSSGPVKYYGKRLGMEVFRCFFDAKKNGAKAQELANIYERLKNEISDLPPNPRSMEDKAAALRDYEAANIAGCVLIPSEDNFYGVNSTGKLAPFVQWVYVPAVKDAEDEGQEAKNTALGKLVARAVRSKTNFDAEIEALKAEATKKYNEVLERNRGGLADISAALQRRLESWAHPDVRFGMEWISDPNKSVTVQPPVAGIKTGEGDFLGSLARMGHGLQRSYLLALLQELADADAPDAPTLILGCEEPELYEHPPQARHLANVFTELATTNNQILVTTHSPLFVSGEGFEDVRLVCRSRNDGSSVRSVSFGNLCSSIRTAMGEDSRKRSEGLVAKIHQALQPTISEMFFARLPILVEGLEDVAYITSQLHLLGLWTEFRRLGCHLIPVGGKDRLIQPLAVATELKMPVFLIFDADGDTKRQDHLIKHERDNRALMYFVGYTGCPFPSNDSFGKNYAIWTKNLTKAVRADFQNEDLCRFLNSSRKHYAHEGGLEKHELFIADWLSTAFAEGQSSSTLTQLSKAIISFAEGI